jgi:hypothetical protein
MRPWGRIIVLWARSLIAATAVIVLSCRIVPVGTDPAPNPYHTEHFTIFYDSPMFGPEEIERIGMLKESLLEHVNNYFSTDYDRRIEVIIADTIGNPHAHYYERIEETGDYARTARGHEIAHVVTMQTWGWPAADFISEGVAVAAERSSEGDALERYRKRFSSRKRTPENPVTAMGELREDLFEGDFDYTTASYARAGAFVQFLLSQYGIGYVRDWYIATVGMRYQGGIDREFVAVFDMSVDSTIARFAAALKD